MTHAELVARAERWLLNTIGCGVVLTEPVTLGPEIPDVIGWKDAMSWVVECKASRSDFLQDGKKVVRQHPEMGMGCRRYYMCPPQLITVEDIKERQEGWGLLWVNPKQVRVKQHSQIFQLDGCGVRSETRVMVSALWQTTEQLRYLDVHGDARDGLPPGPFWRGERWFVYWETEAKVARLNAEIWRAKYGALSQVTGIELHAGRIKRRPLQ